ncbi:MAG: hypothetical protein ACKOPT_07115, partial [Cyanobium sp.]
RWGLIQGGREVRAAALEAGAWGCVISGAGPTLLALSEGERAQEVGQAMVATWEAHGVTSRHAGVGLQQSGSAWTALPGPEEPAPVAPKRPAGAPSSGSRGWARQG